MRGPVCDKCDCYINSSIESPNAIYCMPCFRELFPKKAERFAKEEAKRPTESGYLG